MSGFSVTFATITPESAEHGDYEETGFAVENVSLREAWDAMGRFVTEDSGYWFSNSEYGHGTRDYYENGREEERNLHPPKNITSASYARLRKLFNVR